MDYSAIREIPDINGFEKYRVESAKELGVYLINGFANGWSEKIDTRPRENLVRYFFPNRLPDIDSLCDTKKPTLYKMIGMGYNGTRSLEVFSTNDQMMGNELENKVNYVCVCGWKKILRIPADAEPDEHYPEARALHDQAHPECPYGDGMTATAERSARVGNVTLV